MTPPAENVDVAPLLRLCCTREPYRDVLALRNVAFFLGTMNVALTAFLLGACPKYFWVWQVTLG